MKDYITISSPGRVYPMSRHTFDDQNPKIQTYDKELVSGKKSGPKALNIKTKKRSNYLYIENIVTDSFLTFQRPRRIRFSAQLRLGDYGDLMPRLRSKLTPCCYLTLISQIVLIEHQPYE